MAGFFRVDKTQDGFVRDYILERESAPGVFDVVTFVEWADASVLERVKAAVARRHAELGFDREELVRRLGIRAEIGSYLEVDLAGAGVRRQGVSAPGAAPSGLQPRATEPA